METPVVNQPLTLEEFLAGDYESYEFVEGKLVPIAAAKIIHGEISVNIIFHLVNSASCIRMKPSFNSIWTLDKMNFWGRKRENGKTRKRDRERNSTLSRSQQWQIGSITRYFERNRFLLKPPNNYPASCLRHQKTAES